MHSPRSIPLSLLLLAVSLASCSSTPDPAPGVGLTGSGGAGATGAGPAGTGGDGGAGGSVQPTGPHLVLPHVIDLPYVVAGQGGSTRTVDIENDGSAATGALAWTLSGSPHLTLTSAPEQLATGETAPLTIAFDGSPSETIESATLSVVTPEGTLAVPVFAVAGDPGLGSGTWEAVAGAGGFECGEGITVSMPTAPFPHGGAPYTDDRVRVFLPEGYRDRGSEDLVVHFHGHSTTLADTLAGHRYEGHVCSSGVNAVLVVPQGPYETASGDFGKLMDPGGLEALLREVLVLLYREGRIESPVIGDLVLTSHSGGYAAVAENLDPAINALPVRQVDLFDSMYAYEPTFVGYVEAGGTLRSNYTAGGGTLDSNQAAIAMLQGDGVAVVTEPSQVTLRDAAAVLYFADTTHTGSTRLDGAYGEQLRWGMRHHRRGPRVELRRAIAEGGTADVRWLAPVDEDTTGFRVQTSTDGAVWTTAAEVGASRAQASFAWSGSGRVRVVPVVAGFTDAEVLPSDVYRMDDQPDVLVVDAFDRNLDGSYGGLSHDFAAIVGEAAGHVATISDEAVGEEGFDLSPWPAVIWLAGDDAVADRPITAAEQQALSDYVSGGGAVVVSGSEIGYDLAGSASGAAFLSSLFGAQLATDDSGSFTVSGVGPLAALGSLGYSGPGAPYDEDYPDGFDAIGPGEAVLVYGTGSAAAVGLVSSSVLVGFPLELVDDDADRAALVAALLGFTGG